MVRIAVMAWALVIALGACGRVQGDAAVDSEPSEGAIGKGPGLLTGKRGAIVIYDEPWTGAAPIEGTNAAE